MLRFLKIMVILAAVCGGGYYAYSYFMHSAQQQGMEGGAMPVSVAKAVERNIRQWQEFSGRLAAVDSAEIRPQISGTVEKIHFTEGARVKKGDLLFTLDQRSYKAELDAARARYNLAKTEFDRASGLVEKNIIAQSEYDRRKNNLAVAEADLKREKVNYDYTLIRAPFDGRVSRAEITVGNLVTAGAGAPVLTRIVSDRPIYADFDIDERTFLAYLQAAGTDVDRLKDIPVYLHLSDQQQAAYEGYVKSFDNQLNPSTGTLRVRAVFENAAGELVPGLFARVRVGSPAERAVLLITDRAIGTDQNNKFVLVVKPDNTVEYRRIELGGMAEGLRIVESGLQVGESIIVNGLQRAQPGSTVVPEEVAMDAAEAPAPEAVAAQPSEEAQSPQEAP